MFYHVKVTFNNYAPADCHDIDDEFTGVFINDNSEILFLYTHYIDEKGQKTVERISIPLRAVDTVEIKPIYYEDSR